MAMFVELIQENVSPVERSSYVSASSMVYSPFSGPTSIASSAADSGL